MYFVIHKNHNQPQSYWWVIKSDGNHATLAHSEMYAKKSDCIHAMTIVAREAGTAVYHDMTGEQ